MSKPVGQLLLCSFSASSFEENYFFSMHKIDSFQGKCLCFVDISFFYSCFSMLYQIMYQACIKL